MRDATGQAVKELLAAALRKLYEKLTVTRGQVALAMELYVAENLSPQAKDIIGAVSEAMAMLGVEASATHEGEELLVRVVPCSDCISPGICPLPFYLAAYVKKATSKRLLVAKEEQRTEGSCSFRFRLVNSS